MLLACCFAWAGAAKAVAGGVTTAQFATLGLPKPALLARFVPVAELGLAAGLLLAPRPAAVAAIALLVAFSAVLARAMRAGLRAGCGCFGATKAEPVSTVDLARNGALMLCAVAAMGTAQVVVPGLAATIAASTAALVAFLILALLRLRRDVGSVWAIRT